MEKKQKILKILSIVSMAFTLICCIGATLVVIKNKMLLNNPIFSDNLVNNIVFQDALKGIMIFAVFLFQLKLYKRKEYLLSILLYLMAIFIYNLNYFFL
ncbi:hypothetical protein P3875_01000 [Myroides sp. JBRI-B21084]|uniref:hypothetical protein n=1 Tax=Myroides sp. JBRI-B21084 TaxID=3119977 RepID=UPI0026E2E776|nr:hypothetical protein [Paenimyroides cloacae]WKW46682.1 hypothetical protein P3875_01000 [Paenimyroides cloacae]